MSNFLQIQKTPQYFLQNPSKFIQKKKSPQTLFNQYSLIKSHLYPKSFKTINKTNELPNNNSKNFNIFQVKLLSKQVSSQIEFFSFFIENFRITSRALLEI
jgi:hypothetical protein